jgi:hypothetical protein
MKRATLTAVPASAPASDAGDLTDRLLNRESSQGSAPPAPKAQRSRRPGQRPAGPKEAADAETDTLGAALQAAQSAVEALKAAALAEPARYEVAVRFRLDSLAHHVEQVKDYLAATLAR